MKDWKQIRINESIESHEKDLLTQLITEVEALESFNIGMGTKTQLIDKQEVITLLKNKRDESDKKE